MNLQEYRDEAFIIIDKPLKWTSFDVVNKIKIALRAKVGHCGTLDPLATGLLVLCTGKATKKVSEIQNTDKEYTGIITLGATTPSFDMETEVDAKYDFSHVTESLIREIALKFIGESEQSPPAYSAKKKEGKRYYDMAREGEIFEIKKNKVHLKEFEITNINLPYIEFRILTGKGYYVRSLANDLGKALSTGAYLSTLRRTKIGNFKIEDAWQVNDFIAEIKNLKAAHSNDAGTLRS